MKNHLLLIPLLLFCCPAFKVDAAETCFAFASDTHVIHSSQGLARLTDSAAKRGASCLWVIGDLVDDGNSASAWQLFTNEVNASNLPVFCSAGNHDFTGFSWGKVKAKDKDWSVFSKYLGGTLPRTEMIGSIPALVICPTWAEWDDYEEQVSWLSKKLSTFGNKNSPLVVINHFRPDEKILPLLNGSRPVLWFSGHEHFWVNQAAGGAWNLGSPFHPDGFWLITVDGDKVEAEKCDADGKGLERLSLKFYPAEKKWKSSSLPFLVQKSVMPRSIKPLIKPPLRLTSGVVTSLVFPESPGRHTRIVEFPRHGVLRGTVPSLFYWPAPGFVGEDTFSVAVSDGISVSTPTAVKIQVPASAKAPTPPWCVDTFSGAVGDLLAGRKGGEGWGGAWNATAGTLGVDPKPIFPRKEAGQVCVDLSGNRRLARKYGAATEELWLAVLMRECSAEAVARIQLMDGEKPGLSLYLDKDQKTWFLDQKGIPEPPPKGEEEEGSNSDAGIMRSQEPRLWLLRVLFKPEGAQVAVWYDPDFYHLTGHGCSIYSVPAFQCDTLSLSGKGVVIDAVATAADGLSATSAVLDLPE